MNEPLRKAIAQSHKVNTGTPIFPPFLYALMEIFRTTLTDLQSEMPTIKPSKPDLLSDSYRRVHNLAVKQQQDAFNKVLEGMK